MMLERTENATICYLSLTYQPVEKDAAELVRIKYDDGRVALLLHGMPDTEPKEKLEDAK